MKHRADCGSSCRNPPDAIISSYRMEAYLYPTAEATPVSDVVRRRKKKAGRLR